MGYAKHIGRVGALAVALGVGAAVASGPGVVWAQDGNASVDADNESQQSNSATPPAPESPSGTPTGTQQSDPSPGESVEEPTSSTTEQKDSLVLDGEVVISADGEVRSGARNGQHNESTDEKISEEKGGEEALGSGAEFAAQPEYFTPSVTIESPPAAGPPPVTVRKGSQSESSSGALHGITALSTGAKDIQPPTSLGSPPAHVAVPVVDSALRSGARVEPSFTSAANEVPDIESIALGDAPSVPTEPVSVVTHVLASLLNPFGLNTSNVPVDSPVMWMLAATVVGRRFGAGPDAPETAAFATGSFDNSLMISTLAANSAPTVEVVASPPSKTGVIKGQLIANDPEGDRLTYAGSTTAKGSVVIDSRGRFTYTPTVAARHNAAAPDAAATGAGEDSFTLTVNDGQGNVVSVPLTVTIVPANSAPSNGRVSFGTPDPATGAVTGTITARDRDGDDISLSGPVTTSKGSIVYNSANDTFTYTPTPEARQAASAPRAAKTAKTDTFTVTISDGYGGTGTVNVTVTIAPSSVNQAPTITTSSGSTSYTEQAAPKVVDTGLNLADADNTTLSGATVSIGTPNSTETLAFTAPAGSNITGSYNIATGVLTLTGTSSVANYQAALRSVTYHNTSDTPPATGTISYTVTDGTTPSTTAIKTLAITAVNDTPTVTTTAGTTSYTEQGAPTTVDNGLTLVDADNTNLSGATVTIGSANSTETLAFTAPAGSNITGSYNNATGVLTLTGTSSVANYQTALRSVTYHNTSDTPPATRTISYTVTDGTTPSTTATKTLAITAVNDTPTVTTTAGTTSYTEQAAPTTVDNGLTLADADNTTLSGATVSIGTPNSTETLAFTAPAGSNITGSYNNATGVLTLTGASSVANYQTALRSVTYHNTSDTPPATRTISYTVTDGTTPSTTATKTLAITAVNDTPTVTTTAGTTGYTEQGTPVIVDSGLTVDPYTNLSGATVSIGAAGSTERLTFTAPAGSNITGSYNSTTGVLTLNGTSSVANYQTALRSVTYHNTTDTPAATRTISYTITDGITPSTTATKTITITAVNDAPELQSCGCTVTASPNTPTRLSSTITIDDADDATLEGATVAITSGLSSGDVLALSPNPLNGIAGTYNAATGVLTLTGNASVADYRTALRSVTYTSNNAAIDTTRTVAFTVNDGALSSNTVTNEVAVKAANIAPTGGTPVVETDPITGVVTGSVPFTDADGDQISYTVAPAVRGSVTIDQTTGTFTYTPSAAARQLAATTAATDAQKQDTIVVLADDGKGGVTAVGITVDVAPANNAINESPVAGAPVLGTPSVRTGAVRGTVPVTDPDNDPLRYTVSSSPTKGTVSVDPATGSFTYKPLDLPAFGITPRHDAAADSAVPEDMSDTFTVTVSDLRGGTTQVEVTVPISPKNSSPVLFSQTVNTASASGVVTGSLTIFDGDADELSFTASTPAKGTLDINPTNGSFTYTPDTGARDAAASPMATAADLVDTFVVTIDDGHGGVLAVPVTVAVLPTGATPNTAPSRNADGFDFTSRNTATGATTGTVSVFDSNGDTLTFTATQPTKGTVTVNPATGAFTYTPTAEARHDATAAGATLDDTRDTFTIVAADGRGNATSIRVTVPIGLQNEKPVLDTTTVGTPDASTGVVVGQVIATDPDDDTITYVGPTTTAKGSVIVDRTTGAFTYTPAAAARFYAGAPDATDADKFDSFTVTAYDNYGDFVSEVITVAIEPSSAPNTAPTQIAPTTVGEPDPDTGEVSGHFNLSNLDRDVISYTIEPIAGSRVEDGLFVIDDGRYTENGVTGAWTFIPTDERRHEAALETGGRPDIYSFRWTATDSRGGVTTGEVSVVISPANQAPVVGVPVQSKNASTGATTGTFIAYDPDGDYLDVSVVSQPQYGTVSAQWVGGKTYQWTYTPEAGQPENYTPGFTLVVDDGHTGQTFDFRTVDPNAATSSAQPVRTGLATNRPTDPATGAISGTVPVPNSEGRTLTYTVQDTPTRGSVTLDSATGAYTFVPAAAARYEAAATTADLTAQTDEFTVVVTEDGQVVDVIPITVPISAINRRPVTQVVVDDPEQFGTIPGRVIAFDPDGDELTYSGPQTSRLGGQVSVAPNGSFSYSPNPTFRAIAAEEPVKDYFFVTITEEHGRKTYVRVVIDVPPLDVAITPPTPPRYAPPPVGPFDPPPDDDDPGAPTNEPDGPPINGFPEMPGFLDFHNVGDVKYLWTTPILHPENDSIVIELDDYYSVTAVAAAGPNDIYALQIENGVVTGFQKLTPGQEITGQLIISNTTGHTAGCFTRQNCIGIDSDLRIAEFAPGTFPVDLFPGSTPNNGGEPITDPSIDPLDPGDMLGNEADQRDKEQRLDCMVAITGVIISTAPLPEAGRRRPGIAGGSPDHVKEEATESTVEAVTRDCRPLD